MASRTRRPALAASHERFKKKLRQAPKKSARTLSLYPSVRGNREKGPFPMQKSCQMVYTSFVDVSIIAGFGKYTFWCNGLFDPDLTGTGTQPMYFDQLSALYNHYTVTSSFIEVQPLGSTLSRDYTMAIYVDDDSTTDNSVNVMAQRPGAKVISFNPVVSTPSPVTLGWSAYRTFGPNVLNNGLLRGSVTTNPTEGCFYCMGFYDTGLNTQTLPVRVKLTFNVVWTEYTNVSQS